MAFPSSPEVGLEDSSGLDHLIKNTGKEPLDSEYKKLAENYVRLFLQSLKIFNTLRLLKLNVKG